MPEAPKSRWIVRVAAAATTFGVAYSGVFAVSQGSSAPAAVAGPKPTITTTSTTAPPPPSPTTTTTLAPAPPTTSPPTTVAPRPVAAAAPAPAHAPAYQSQSIQARGEAALALINYPWQRLGYAVSFEPAVQGYLGVTNSGTRTISIYIRDKQSLDSIARTIAHEMGHAFDFQFMSVAEAQQYIAIRGINATSEAWFGCNACSDFQTAAGDFAETFQYWLLGDGEFLSQMGPPPTAEQLAQLAPIFTI